MEAAQNMSLGPGRYDGGLGRKLLDISTECFIFPILEPVNKGQAMQGCAQAPQTFTFVTT